MRHSGPGYRFVLFLRVKHSCLYNKGQHSTAPQTAYNIQNEYRTFVIEYRLAAPFLGGDLTSVNAFIKCCLCQFPFSEEYLTIFHYEIKIPFEPMVS